MNRCALIPAAWLLDQLAGDPEWFPHPVRLVGIAIARGESLLRRPGQSQETELVSGAALSLAVLATAYYTTRQLICLAHRRSYMLGNAVETILAWTCVAARNLEQETSSVVDALDSSDLPLARRRLARIVGRDTEHLESNEVCRALIETLAESACDGIVAPLFYMALGGVPLAMAYKAINTLDSMIGHADVRYFYFGKVAARLDDAANYLPARLSAVFIAIAANFNKQADARSAWQTWRRDGDEHKSPNAGQPESAMAGALHVRLGGHNTYSGELVRAAHMGREFSPPSLPKARIAVRLVSVVTMLGVVCGAFLAVRFQPRQEYRTCQ